MHIFIIYKCEYHSNTFFHEIGTLKCVGWTESAATKPASTVGEPGKNEMLQRVQGDMARKGT